MIFGWLTFEDVQYVVFKVEDGLVLVLLFNLESDILFQNFVIRFIDKAYTWKVKFLNGRLGKALTEGPLS